MERKLVKIKIYRGGEVIHFAFRHGETLSIGIAPYHYSDGHRTLTGIVASTMEVALIPKHNAPIKIIGAWIPIQELLGFLTGRKAMVKRMVKIMTCKDREVVSFIYEDGNALSIVPSGRWMDVYLVFPHSKPIALGRVPVIELPKYLASLDRSKSLEDG